MDNLEHLLAAAPLVGELLAACAGLKVLATSREALRLQGEHRYALAPLDVPPGDSQPAAVERAAAGALFVERALSHDRDFELTPANAGAIADVCRRLDGLPLAIELAAARTALLGPERALRSPGRGAGRARKRPARRSRSPANAARHHRLEPPPAQRPRGGGVCPLRRVRRRGHARGRPGGHRRRPRHARGARRQATAAAPPSAKRQKRAC